MTSLLFFSLRFFLYASHSAYSSYYSLSNKVIVRWENEIEKDGESEVVIEKNRISIFLTILLPKFHIKQRKRKTIIYFTIFKLDLSNRAKARTLKKERKTIDLWTIFFLVCIVWVNIEEWPHRENATIIHTRHSDIAFV